MRTVLCLCALIWAAAVSAADFCVTGTTALANALNAADDNGEDDIIRLAVGIYPVPVGGFKYNDDGVFDLQISGGWEMFFGDPCGIRLGGDAFDTVLDGLGAERILELRLSANADVKIDHVLFTDGFVAGDNARGGAIDFNTANNYSGEVLIESNAFINNYGTFASAFSIASIGHLVVRNNLFYANEAGQFPTVSILMNAGEGVHFTNNTVYGNTTESPLHLLSGVSINIGNPAQAFVGNNILWGNEGGDIRVIGSGHRYLSHNVVDVIDGFFDEEVNTIHVAPQFENGPLNFTPARRTPMVDAGTRPPGILPFPTPFDLAWSPGDFDYAGVAREQMQGIDIGARESGHEKPIFYHGFEAPSF